MINCITQSVEEYSVLHETGLFRVGIGTLEETEPALFSILSLMSPVFYEWEFGSPVPVDKRCADIDGVIRAMYKDSLQTSVGGMSVVQWLSVMDDPVSLYMVLEQYSLAGLPILQYYTLGQLRLIMRGRCYSWLKAQPFEKAKVLLEKFSATDEYKVKEAAYGKYNRA